MEDIDQASGMALQWLMAAKLPIRVYAPGVFVRGIPSIDVREKLTARSSRGIAIGPSAHRHAESESEEFR